MHKIIQLLKWHLKSEWRMRFALNGILLHVISSVFLVQLCIHQMALPVWNALMWILLVFSAVSAAGRSFLQDTRGKWLYIYNLASPGQFILSRIIYNTLLMWVVTTLNLLVFALFNGFPVQEAGWYYIILISASIGYAGIMTLMSAVAGKSGNGYLLLPLLSFPLVLPILLVGIRAAKKTMDGIPPSFFYTDIMALITLNSFIVAMAWYLFPYLWKE